MTCVATNDPSRSEASFHHRAGAFAEQTRYRARASHLYVVHTIGHHDK